MRTHITALTVVVLLCLLAMPIYAADNKSETSIEDGRLQDYLTTVSKQFGVDEKKLVRLNKDYHIPADALPPIYYIANKADVNPQVVIDLRLEGKAFWEIAIRLHLKAEHFYLPVKTRVTKPPYANLLAKFQADRDRWIRIALTDTEMINLINLHMMHERFDVDYTQVINWRTDGETFVEINQRAYYHKHGKPAPAAMAAEAEANAEAGESKAENNQK